MGTFTKTVVLPDTGVNWTGLFSSVIGSRRYQALVRAQEIRGSGSLQSLAFRLGAASTGNSCPNVTVRLVHRSSSAPALGATFANNFGGRGQPVTAFGPATLSIPAGIVGDDFTVPLNGAFNYNGVDDLIVDIESDACTANTELAAHDANPAYTALIYNMADRAAATGLFWSSLADVKLGFAGGGNQVQSPGAVVNLTHPFANSASYPSGIKIQQLYYPDEIGGSGPITGLAFSVSATTTAQTRTVTVRFGHSTLATLTTTFASNYNSGAPVTLANAVTFEIPAGVPAGRYLWVPLPDGTFNYNGTDNLVVEIEASTVPASVTVQSHDDGTQRRLVGVPASTTGTLYTVVNDIQLRFAGGTMDTITPAAMGSSLTDVFPFAGTDGRRQFLYRATELGTRGTISKVACRAGPSDGGPAETGINYTVMLSHGTAATLGTDFAANLVSPVTVFNGTFNLPAVAAGDWIEIPFTTPFAYNGRDNLVLDIAGTGGTTGGFACALDSATTTLYASRRLFGATAGSATGSASNAMIDTRFTLQ